MVLEPIPTAPPVPIFQTLNPGPVDDDDPYNFDRGINRREADNDNEQLRMKDPAAPYDNYFSFVFKAIGNENECEEYLQRALTRYQDLILPLNDRTLLVGFEDERWRPRYGSLMGIPDELSYAPPESQF